jgi:glycosyl transferase, family 25
MLVLVINLDRAPARLAHMERELGRLGIAFERLSATDGQTLEGVGEMSPIENRRLSPGERACFMSHRRCWQQLVDSGQTHAVVLEDDVFLSQAAASILSSADWFPATAGLVKLETYLAPTLIDAQPVSRLLRSGVHRLHRAHLGTGAYALDASTARMLLAASTTIDRQIDSLMFDPRSACFEPARVHQMVPAVAIQGLKLAKLRPLDDVSTFASHLYDERLGSRARLGVVAKIRREIAKGATRVSTMVGEKAAAVFSGRKWGVIPFE